MAWGSIIGAGIGLLGNALSADSQADAAQAAAQQAQFVPWAVGASGMGDVGYDMNTRQLTATMDPQLRQLQGLLGGQAMDQLLGRRQAAGLQDIYGAGNIAAGQMPGLFRGAMADQGRAYANLTQGANVAGAQDRLLAGEMQALPGQALQIAQGPGAVDPSSRAMIGRGLGLINQDVGDIYSDTLSQLRGSARPDEERAVNSRVQSLFNKGILSSTSGARSLGELAMRQEQADMQRQAQAMGLAQNQFGMNMRAGEGLLSGGQQGILGGLSQNRMAAGLYGNLGQGMLGMRADRIDTGFDRNAIMANALQNRGLQRLNMAQGMFGFGQDALAGSQQIVGNAMNGMLGVNADLRDLLALSVNAGSASAAAGANQAQVTMDAAGSPLGGFLGGIGESVLSHTLPNLIGDAT